MSEHGDDFKGDIPPPPAEGNQSDASSGNFNDPEIQYQDAEAVIIRYMSPPLSNELTIDEMGRFIQPFGEKFDPMFEGWQPGSLVRGRFNLWTQRLIIGEEGPRLLENEVDVRDTDAFYLTPTDEHLSVLREIGPGDIEAVVEVQSTGEQVSQNSFQYRARIVEITAVQPLWDGETEPQVGDRILMEGEVVSCELGPTRIVTLTLRLDNGREVAINLANGRLGYEEGVLPLIHRQQPEAGDRLKVNTTFGLFSSGSPAFWAEASRCAVLTQAGPGRQAAFEAQRAAIAEALQELQQLEGAAFRQAYASLLRTYEQESGIGPYLPFTAEEQARLAALIDQAFPDQPDGQPSPERPVAAYDISTAFLLDQDTTLNVDMLSLSRQELYNLALELAQGQRELPHYAAGVIKMVYDFFPPEERAIVCRHILDHYTPQFFGETILAGAGEGSADARLAATTKWLVASNAINAMGDLAKTNTKARDYLYDLCITLLHQELSNEQKNILVGSICNTLETIASEAIDIDQTSGEMRISRPEIVSYFQERLFELLSHDRLQSRALERGQSNHSYNEFGGLIRKLQRLFKIAGPSENN